MAADVNRDGHVNSADVILLRRYIAGGYGVELDGNSGSHKHTMEHIDKVDATCTENGNQEYFIVNLHAWQACWGYRHSMMGDAGWAVLSATLQLRPDSPSEIRARMDDLAQRRAEKQPLEMPSAGSTFKRPAGYFAGKLIQDAGLRGFRVGGAQVSEKHTGFVVNAGGATARDVRDLIAEVQRRVYEMEGVRMYPEVRMWGFEGEE